MEDVFTNRIEIFGEITNLVLMYHVLLFTDFVGDIPIRYSIGYSFIFFTGIFISVHLYLMLRDSIVKFRENQKRKQKIKADEEALLRSKTRKMEKFKSQIITMKENNSNQRILGDFDEIIDLDNIANMQLEEYENMKDQVAHMKKVRERQIAYSAF